MNDPMLINTNLNLKGKNIIKHLHPYLNPTILSRSRVGFRNFNKIDTIVVVWSVYYNGGLTHYYIYLSYIFENQKQTM